MLQVARLAYRLKHHSDGVVLARRRPRGSLLLALAAVLGAMVPSVAHIVQRATVAQAAIGYPQTVLADRPVSYWRLNETSGSTAADQQGANAGTISGAVTLGGVGPVVGGGSMAFAGGDVYLGQSSSLMPVGNFSIEAWVKFTAAQAASCANDYGGDYCLVWRSHAFGAAIGVLKNGALQGDFYSSSSVAYGTTTPSTYNDDAWHHMVLVRDTARLTMYVDGAAASSTPVSEPTTFYCCELQVAIGNDPSCTCSPFYGSLSEVAFYSSPLSATQVSAHYAAAGAQPGAGTDLVAIACSDVNTCFAVGGSSGMGALVVIKNGSRGSVQVIPDTIVLNGIACESSMLCVAVGVGPTGAVTVPITPTGPGATTVVTVTAGATGSSLVGVACPSPNLCAAIGGEDTATGVTAIYVAILNGVPSPAMPEPVVRADAIACPSTSVCELVGSQITSVSALTGAPYSAAALASGTNLTAISCPTQAMCLAVGETNDNAIGVFGGVNVSIGITDPTHPSVLAQEAPYALLATHLLGLVCPPGSPSFFPATIDPRGCMAVGQRDGSVGVIRAIAGSDIFGEQQIPTPPDATIVVITSAACPSASSCFVVGGSDGFGESAAGLIYSMSPQSYPSLNSGSCTSATGTADNFFDAVSDVAAPSQAFTSVSASIGPRATICRDQNESTPPSAWVMLQPAPNSSVAVQAGILYLGNGLDQAFVEWPNLTSYRPTGPSDDTVYIGAGVQFVCNTTSSCPSWLSHDMSGGRFTLVDHGQRPYTQCPWVRQSRGRLDYYKVDQGDVSPPPGETTHQIEATINGHCLWIFYVPTVYNGTNVTPFSAADIAVETDSLAAEIPGTITQPLLFSGVTVTYGGTSENFVSDGSGSSMNPTRNTAPTTVYVNSFGTSQSNSSASPCQMAAPNAGSAYAFSVWTADTKDQCAPWYVSGAQALP